ncbi:MAG: hypothetical protein NC299_17935 [Lachnospiraceae bacterium]|nr:hypothetical protein [Lachnospiraceae bacterium]
MTVKEFFALKGGTDYYEVNICNVNTDEVFHTNADEIDNEDIFEHSGYNWGNSKIASWEFDGETFEISVM